MYDVIVIGSGIAGLFTALRAAEHGTVLVLTKSALEESNTRYAQGGIAAAWAADDSPALHSEDTLAAGAGLCDPAAVAVLTAEAPARIRDLLAVGVPFDEHDGALALGLEGAHGQRRILHAGGDATGFHIEQALCRALRAAGVAFVEGCFVTELVVEGGRVVGVEARVGDGPAVSYGARHVVLASGGAGQLFAYTTNPAVATGDGLALAYRAGAALADVEFYQFHPTALTLPGAATFLISEAVRGEGGHVLATDGRRFMLDEDPRAELAPRDVVARAIVREMARTGADHVLLDVRHLDPAAVRAHFPTINAHCLAHGLDMTVTPVPVAPAAHYLMGGVRTDVWGATSVPGLYACGEVACTGVHGANRLASNSLLEGIVFGARIVAGIVARRGGVQLPTVMAPAAAAGWRPDVVLTDGWATDGPSLPAPTLADVQRLMWSAAGLVREAAGLTAAVATLSAWLTQAPAPQTVAEHELHNELLVGWLMARAALARAESRGGHYRSDAPQTEPQWQRRIVQVAPVTVAATTVEVLA